MWLQPLEVECYAGHKAAESPRRFTWEDRTLEVVEIVDRWHQGHPDPEWPLADYFKALAEDGHLYLLKHDLEADTWHFCRRW